MDNLIIISTSNDPWYNLALEEYLLNQLDKNEVILYLWQNQRTVVIGKNQNPWKECRVKKLQSDGGKLARRMSGGGAVYHDLGNLNFTFILPEKLYNQKRQFNTILKAVKAVGIEAEFSGRNDLIVRDKKFSGNAFYHSGELAYHHGTILIDTDFKNLVEYLQVSEDKIKAKGVESVRSRVINLNEIQPELTIEKMKQAVADSFIEVYQGNPNQVEMNPKELDQLKQLYQKYSSWDWRFGRTPEFDIIFENKFDWGSIELRFNLNKGFINLITIYSDAMEVELIEKISSVLEGIPYKKEEITANLKKLGQEFNQDIIKDLTNWFKSKLND